MMTVEEAWRDAATRIAAADVGDTSRLDAELLVRHVAGLDDVGIRMRSDCQLLPEQQDQLKALVLRRAGGEPVAYLLGTAWFYGHELQVDARVLIPRPETELLVELALAHYADRASPAIIVDACTGSGCVAISIAAELGDRAIVHGTDISAGALIVARANAVRLRCAVTWHEGDLLAPVAALRNVAAIVANPPYVEGAQAIGLEPGVRDHEPHVALFVPHDESVTALYARLAAESLPLLEPAGLLAVEHGQGQREHVVAALQAAGCVDVIGHDDLAGIDRVVVGYRPPGVTN